MIQNVLKLLDIYKEDYKPPRKFLKELESTKIMTRSEKCLAKGFLSSIKPHLNTYREAQDDNSHLEFLKNEFIIESFRGSIDLSEIYHKVKDRYVYIDDNSPTLDTLDYLMFEMIENASSILRGENEFAESVYNSLY